MTADLDTKITSALRAAASTIDSPDDALGSILDRAARRPPTVRRRRLLTGVVTLAVLMSSGAAYALVANRLTPEQADLLAQIPTCGLDAETARLVASTSTEGRTLEFWTVDTATSHGDFLFVRGDTEGGGGCGPVSRTAAHPTLPWVNYQLTENGDGTGDFWFMGQGPPGTAEVAIVTDAGTTRARVVSPDGYFVAMMTLPLPGGDRIQRIDAFGSDGSLLGTGGIS